MEEIIEALSDPDDAMPVIHQFSKLMLSVAAGFAAKKLVGKAYMAGLECYKLRKATASE